MISSSQLSGSTTSLYLCLWCIRDFKNCLQESRISLENFFVSSLFSRNFGFSRSTVHKKQSILTHWGFTFWTTLWLKYVYTVNACDCLGKGTQNSRHCCHVAGTASPSHLSQFLPKNSFKALTRLLPVARTFILPKAVLFLLL